MEKKELGCRAIQKIIFTGNLERDSKTSIFFFLEEAKKIILDF